MTYYEFNMNLNRPANTPTRVTVDVLPIPDYLVTEDDTGEHVYNAWLRTLPAAQMVESG